LTDKRLLVIDDDPAIGQMVSAVAEGMGFEVRATERADEFAAIYEDFQPTVVILDLVMPEVDGIELAQWLAHVKSQAQVIFLTGHNPRFTDAARALADSGDLKSVTTLTKPISTSILRQAISEMGTRTGTGAVVSRWRPSERLES
jgi:DNA-binding response OmpR family regulator